jgi:hypothetical protein
MKAMPIDPRSFCGALAAIAAGMGDCMAHAAEAGP